MSFAPPLIGHTLQYSRPIGNIQHSGSFIPCGRVQQENESCLWRQPMYKWPLLDEVAFAIGSQFIRPALHASEPIADSQGNTLRIPYLPVENHSTRCRYPAWVTEHHHWHTLNHRHSYHFSTKNATLKITEEAVGGGGQEGATIERRVVCHTMEAASEKQAMLVAHLTTGWFVTTLFPLLTPPSEVAQWLLAFWRTWALKRVSCKGDSCSLASCHIVSTRKALDWRGVQCSLSVGDSPERDRIFLRHANKCKSRSRRNFEKAAVTQWLGRSHPTNAKRLSIPGGVAPGFPHVGIVPDDAAGRRVFSEISRFPSPLHSGAAPFSPSSALHTSMLRVAQNSPSPFRIITWNRARFRSNIYPIRARRRASECLQPRLAGGLIVVRGRSSSSERRSLSRRAAWSSAGSHPARLAFWPNTSLKNSRLYGETTP
ncbi:hypothetical protein PR048_010620 [Dryococelus australis]|uniref:Uncharacterized protein n=1 Tax=Dryococelus australis TaxID=614101 RepID=A0ABQ9I383_9NEOP|nr:hypothetical protein PR048_010620 [Dryococelus australis]